jgi:hypothetical protein
VVVLNYQYNSLVKENFYLYEVTGVEFATTFDFHLKNKNPQRQEEKKAFRNRASMIVVSTVYNLTL